MFVGVPANGRKKVLIDELMTPKLWKDFKEVTAYLIPSGFDVEAKESA